MGGEGTYSQILHPALCQLAGGHHALGPGEGKGLRGQAMREVVLSHISYQLSTALSSMSPAIPASFHRALACWVSLCLLSASQGGGVPLLPAARHAGQCQATSPASPRQGCSQPAAVAALQGVLQGSEHSVHVVTG